MNNQFKRMQKLAGLITEGVGAYEYEKGKAAGEKIEKKKMKKTDLKKQIKEMILAEMNEGRQYGMSPEEIDAFFRKHPEYDEMGIDDKDKDGYQKVWYSDENGLYQYLLMKSEEELEEAKKKKKDKDEEVEDVEVDTDVDMGDEMDMDAEIDTAPAPAASDVQKELMDALEAAKASGDEKLVRQIGNALTYFTRSQVSKDENPPSMNEELGMDAVDRLEGLANMQDLAVLKAKLRILSSDWMQDGFEKEDIIEYITELINQI
jgi:hypothetical protein